MDEDSVREIFIPNTFASAEKYDQTTTTANSTTSFKNSF